MRKSILIVEDEGIIAMESKMSLLANGYKVVGVASSGKEAMAKFDQEQPDLVLMDIKLKGDINGVDVANYIRHNSTVPILFLTGNSDAATRVKVEGLKGSKLLFKPIQSKDLFLEIKAILES